jgi:hypothetical protein
VDIKETLDEQEQAREMSKDRDNKGWTVEQL